MPSRNLLLLLAIFIAHHQDLGVSSPIHNTHSRSCHWNKFKHLTQTLYNQALKIHSSTNSTDNIVLDDVPRIQCHHHCGPEHLVSHPETCLKRIVHVLSYYESILLTLSTSSQNEDFMNVKKTISNILLLLKACNYQATIQTAPKKVTEEFLKKKIGSPLLSVGILIARVLFPWEPGRSHNTPKALAFIPLSSVLLNIIYLMIYASNAG